MVDKLRELSLITTYFVNKDDAQKLMRELVLSKLAAVVNIFLSQSYFNKQNKITEIQEFKLVAKTLPILAEPVFNYIKNSHPSEIPYIVMQKAQANGEYVEWLSDQVQSVDPRSNINNLC